MGLPRSGPSIAAGGVATVNRSSSKSAKGAEVGDRDFMQTQAPSESPAVFVEFSCCLAVNSCWGSEERQDPPMSLKAPASGRSTQPRVRVGGGRTGETYSFARKILQTGGKQKMKAESVGVLGDIGRSKGQTEKKRMTDGCWAQRWRLGHLGQFALFGRFCGRGLSLHHGDGSRSFGAKSKRFCQRAPA